MAPIKTVALAGANGNLGTPMLKALLDANFQVTVLSRPNSKSTYPPSVSVSKVDFDDLANLTSALKGFDALISTLPIVAAEQIFKLFDAAIAAGVKRVIPSEFGSDTQNPNARKLPVFEHKIEVEEYIERKTRGTDTTYTYVINNAFFDWGVEHGSMVDLKNKKMRMYDGGERYFTTTELAFVAKGTVAVLQHPAETANRAVRLQGTSLTQKKLLEIGQKVVGKDGWTVTDMRIEDLKAQTYEALKADPSNAARWMFGFVTVAVYGEGYGGDFRFNNDNKLLGLTELTEDEVEQVLRSRA